MTTTREQRDVVERLRHLAEIERAQFGPTNNVLAMEDGAAEIDRLRSASQAGGVPATATRFEFDRYVNGKLMAEGVAIERESDLPSAMRKAAEIAATGPNGETPVLVLTASPPPPAPQAGGVPAGFVRPDEWKRAAGSPRRDGPATHNLKCAAGYYEEVSLGRKTAELRIADRDFRMFDIIRLHELEYGKITGRTLDRRITHIVWDSNGPWLAPGYCMLSLEPASPPPPATDGLTIADYEDAFEDHKRLVRRLDVLLNGEAGAAPQASLCDIVGQLEGAKRNALAAPATDGDALRDALEAFVEQRTEIAKHGHKTWTGTEWVWNDDIWRDADPDEFELIERARNALASVPTPTAGSKILAGLQAAAAGNLARVTIEGQTWVRADAVEVERASLNFIDCKCTAIDGRDEHGRTVLALHDFSIRKVVNGTYRIALVEPARGTDGGQMAEHTPGPWKAQGMYVVPVPPRLHGAVARVDGHGSITNEANARLIAAAPAMLEALQRCEALMTGHPMFDGPDHGPSKILIAVTLAIRSALGADASTEGGVE